MGKSSGWLTYQILASIQSIIAQSKLPKVTMVLCHVCGAKGVTLYKDGDKKICKGCMDKAYKTAIW